MNSRTYKNWVTTTLNSVYQYFKGNKTTKTIKENIIPFRFNGLPSELQITICQFVPISMVNLNKHWHLFLSENATTADFCSKTQLIFVQQKLDLMQYRFNKIYFDVRYLENKYNALALALLDPYENPNQALNEIEVKLKVQLEASIVRIDFVNKMLGEEKDADECLVELNKLRYDLMVWHEARVYYPQLLSKISFLTKQNAGKSLLCLENTGEQEGLKAKQA